MEYFSFSAAIVAFCFSLSSLFLVYVAYLSLATAADTDKDGDGPVKCVSVLNIWIISLHSPSVKYLVIFHTLGLNLVLLVVLVVLVVDGVAGEGEREVVAELL